MCGRVASYLGNRRTAALGGCFKKRGRPRPDRASTSTAAHSQPATHIQQMQQQPLTISTYDL